ncbi:MAG: glycosyltransferase, partial [Lachnospiraceae bacterium]|nr:glycosyltransferase [Lachnospiraceae bacterium]MDE7002446.1 glycosyltransferase [Lachnospiraceae bacterium]
MEQDREYKISVVTAVYNVEEYLGYMIESIIAQTIGFENVQLVLVDDGSTDRSGEICDQYADRHPDNIVVLRKENGGVSSARNEGLRHAKGEYVNFTDADDMLEENALQLMYDHLRENGEWIDLCAIPFRLFGARNGSHTLNYRFDAGTRIVDLQQEYDCIQLSINSTLVKRECFKDRKFDEGLAYAEDAQIVIDILLDQMRYGIVCGTNYLYRKREAEDSAIDICGSRVHYYNTTVRRFILYVLENAAKRKGCIPLFVQYTCMYDLQWRLKKHPLVNTGVLTKAEEEEYRNLLLTALQYIDDQVIAAQRNIDKSYKMAILLLKEKNQSKKELTVDENILRVGVEDVLSIDASDYALVFEFIEISSREMVLEGYVKYFAEPDGIGVVLKGICDGDVFAEYKAETTSRKEKCTYCMGQMVTQAIGFKIRIGWQELPDSLELRSYLQYRDHDILCENISFGKFFPLAGQMIN